MEEKPEIKTKDDLEVDNIVDLIRAQMVRQECVDAFLAVVSKFVKFADEDFARLLAKSAENVVMADKNVRLLVSRIGKASPAKHED